MIDNSSCIGAVNTIKGHVTDCFERCSAKGSTFTGTRKLINLDSAISLIPQTITSAKPYKCKLTHIESTGTQYIDTGFVPNNNTRVEVNFETEQAMGCIVGARQKWVVNGFAIHVTAVEYNTQFYTSAFRGLGKVNVLFNKNVLYQNNTVLKTFTTDTFNAPCRMSIFGCSNGTSGSISEKIAMKLYSCVIYDNETKIRDFIPVLDWEDVPCLYDEVEGILYYNAGTGEFIAGDIVGTPITGASFSGFGVTWAELPEESFTIDFGAYGTGWTALSCYSNSKDGHFNIVKISSSMCIISSAYFVDLESVWDDNYGIYPMARGTYRASYSISGNSITFTNAEYDGTGNGMTNYDDFRDMPMQVSTEVNDYYINSYRLDRITVVY